MIVGGIDPGLHGACAVVHDGKLIFIDHFQSVEAKTRGRELLMSQVWKTLACASMYAPDIVFIERVQAMPRQGASSGFKFGVTYGAVLMGCTGLQMPMENAEPRLWMRAFNLHGGQEEQVLATACRLFPGSANQFMPQRNCLTKQDALGRADAALIALWGYRLLTRGGAGDEGNHDTKAVC